MAYQDQHVDYLNEQINPLNYDDFVDKFDNEIHLFQAYVLDLYAVIIEMVLKIHHDILNIDDRFYRMDLYN
jgi:hypothetical protein